MLIAGDVGATKTRLALVSPQSRAAQIRGLGGIQQR